MKIADLKTLIAGATGITLSTLMLVQQKDQTTGVEQPWLSHWDNDKRVRITFPEEVALKIAANPEFDGLSYKREVVAAHEDVAEYTRYVVIIPTSVKMTL